MSLKNVLIISPYFPPSNAADMQRIRMSLPYFRKYGWNPEVVVVDARYADLIREELLNQSIPEEIVIHRVSALNKKWTSRIGLGAIALRSLFHYRRAVNKLLQTKKFDLIYFSTTQYPICALGPFWKKKFGIPYIIDFQDPWYSDHYDHLPKKQRPRKYWFAKRLNKYLEPLAMSGVDGLISVSDGYLSTLRSRYPQVRNLPSSVITFAASDKDLQIAAANAPHFPALLDKAGLSIVYAGRGGYDLHKAIKPVFEVLKTHIQKGNHRMAEIRMYFIGTSYAPSGKGIPTILPLARQFGLEQQVTEITDRIGFYHVLHTLQQASALFIPGAEDPKYTASKIYPYLLLQKPLMAIFNPDSPAMQMLAPFGMRHLYHYEQENIKENILRFFMEVLQDKGGQAGYDTSGIYTAEQMTSDQCNLFNRVVENE